MIDQERLHDLTESYLKSVISEAADSLNRDFDSQAPFGELGINSFQVLKIIRKLEDDFGSLPKTLLFENFNIDDLAGYFVEKHEATLAARFAQTMEGAVAHGGGRRQPEPSDAKPRTARNIQAAAVRESAPILILEKDAYAHPDLKDLVQTLYTRHKIEGCVSRGTRKIAPNLFIGSARRGYFNYGRCKNIIVVYGYTGPLDYLPVLLEEMVRHCTARGFQFNILADRQIPPVAGASFSATPFGALQRIVNLKEFTVEGGAMRRLRYQVSKFQKSGACRTREYRCGSDPGTDQEIAAVIDRWCESRTAVNPLVRDVRAEILAGALSTDHRVFLTYLGDVLQNVIVITAMCAEQNGYLMDLEFYLPEMPLGGLEFTIVQIIDVLTREGCDVLSLGGTYGCKIETSPTADPEIDRILDDLREQNIFNDAGNLQFKNKFRPETAPIFLCRPVGSGNPGNVIDIIMMIADPDQTQTSDEENHNGMTVSSASVAPVETAPRRPAVAAEPARAHRGGPALEGVDRSRILAESGFNPLKIPHEQVDFDLKTDSWAQLEMPAIAAQMRHLHSQLQQPVGVNESLRGLFPFAHFVLTPSGQTAEHIFFKAWPKKGVVPQNLLFPSTIFHQIDKGFSPRELPHPSLFQLHSEEPYKGNMDRDALQALVASDPAALACVCIEVSDNASGGSFVSIQHLRDVKSLLAGQGIPLVLDATRVVENAQFLIEREKEYEGKSLWTAVRDILSCADAMIGSLTKDFCVNKGGIIATNDAGLFHRLEELAEEEGFGVDLIDRKLIALSLQNRRHIEAAVLRRMEHVRVLWQALRDRNVPVVQPAGAHCVLIDVRAIPEFKDLRDPVASFLGWLYVNTGIRGGAHSAGMQKHTAINDLVRLAVPVGLKREQIVSLIDRLSEAFVKKVNIPEVVMESSTLQPLGGVYADYQFIRYHNVSQAIVAKTDSESDAEPLSAPAVPDSDAATTEPVVERGEEVPAAASPRPRVKGPVAVIGMAGRYPKAKNLGELWDNLAAGRDCIEEIPPDRYERRRRHGSLAKYRAGFIDDVDKFDSLFFNISPREAEMLDPQERLFLEVAWEAIEDAGYYPEILAEEDGPRNIGVFVGAVWAMYQMLGVEEKHVGNHTVPNSFLWSVANRVSYAFNLSGPSMTIDTACSSSLTALHLACEAIQNGDCSAAIVGGVNLDLHQAKYDINHQGGALSEDGVCRTFGKGANGYVMGEGIGAIVLKPLDRAVQDGDHIYGVIRSAAVNHGGRNSGYTVPNPKAQGDLVTAAIEKAGIDPRSIGYIEAHGTGTELGDPVEITGLTQAFQSFPIEQQTCAIGSVKTNIGHLEAAAGIVGVTKVLLQMQHRQLVPSLHSAELNEFIDFGHSPFYVVQRLEEWNPKEVDGVRLPLRAGISSFGAGGSNAHVIVESYDAQADREPVQARPLIFPLSARNEDQLREAAVRLAAFLRQNDVDLNSAAYTLQQGRRSFEQRLAVIARSKEELIEKLDSFTSGKKAQDVATGNAKAGEAVARLLGRRERQEFTRMVSQGAAPARLAALWAEGLLADWQGYQWAGAGKRTPLPSYPFADKRHWASGSGPVRAALQPAAGVHPMVDSNESTFERQLFKKRFHEGDFFIYDHLVSDIPTLPGVAYLELVRKAGELAAGRKVQKIRNILWISPISVQNATSKEVFIELKPSGDSVQFEVFSEDAAGRKTPHSQGKLLYATKQEVAAGPETIDLAAVRARCAKVTDGGTAYPLFKAYGLDLGPSFQVLQDVYKNETETLGELRLPEFRQADLETMVLQPSLIDGSLQAGMAGQLGGQAGEMLVPFSIGEVEILQPLTSHCFSYVTVVSDDDAKRGGKSSAVVKTNALIVDETGTILVKIKESVGVPLRQVHKPEADGDSDGFSTLYYSYDWQKAPLAAEPATQNAPASLVLFDTGETRRDLYRERLKQAGASAEGVVLVKPGEGFADAGNQSYTVNPRVKEDYARLFAALAEKGVAVENVCLAWQLGQEDQPLAASLETGVYALLFLCQALVESKLDQKAQLVYLHSRTSNAAQPQNEAVSGFVNTLRVEYPRLLAKTLEVRQESAGDAEVLDALWAELRARTQDANVVRYERGERSIRRLAAFDPAGMVDPAPSRPASIRENGVYLITGGAGGLGLVFAEFLAREHKARVVLTGRSRLSPDLEARMEALRQAGADVHYIPADVSSREDVETLIGECKARFGAINGIIHAAGVLRDSMIRDKTPEEMSAVFAPKVHGTVHLDELTTNEDLDFFVTFSSLAAVAGNGGQSDYSYANSFMDSFAAERERRRAEGARSGKTLSVNWSIWADGGMKLDEQTEIMFRKVAGIKPLSAVTGLGAFVNGLASDRVQFAVLEGLQEKVELAWGLRKKAVPPPAPATAATSGSGEELRAWLQNELTKIVMELLKVEAADVADDKILLDLGFDSIGLTTFANAVNEKFQTDITPVLFFDYPSIGEIAKYMSVEQESAIRAAYGGPATGSAASQPSTAETQRAESHAETGVATRKGWDPASLDRDPAPLSSGNAFSAEHRFVNEPIAIVGMSGVMPQSEDVDEFWENLRTSTDMISVIPEDRFPWQDYFGDPLKEINKTNSKWGGFMKEIDKFDPLFFGISPREADMMDPQQRIFLETVWRAIEDSGQKVSDLSGTRTGLFVGVATNDYVDVLRHRQAALDGYSASGNSHSVLANRISFLLNLHGPSAPIDTACSSSLVALHRAIESIHTRSCDMAIVGGVQVNISPGAFVSFSAAGMLSPDGKCKTFDKSANGYVRGEGSGAILIKRLSAAQADGNHIYAIVKATSENHGGKVTTLTAPNSAAQAELLIEAYEKGQVDPATVGYIECHGTGTSLGDPIEIQALSKAFGELYKRRGRVPTAAHCGLGALKSNIGHLETAAGIAGILKTLLAIKHKQIPANINFEELNPYINLKGTPFYIADRLTPWPAPIGEDGMPAPRRAGISSFGFGGANAHIVLEEYVPRPQARAAATGPQLIVLSAKNEDRLKAYVRSMLVYMDKHEVDLADLAYTLQVGRDEMPDRLALVASNTDDLKRKFEAILGGAAPEDSYHNNVKKKSQPADAAAAEPALLALIERGELSSLGELWTSGAKIDWRLLHKTSAPRRISVPTYPFARERYWVPDTITAAKVEGKQDSDPAGAPVLHPMIHRNVSTLAEQKFASHFTGKEFYLADHRVGTRAVLPGVAYFELAMAAARLSGLEKARSIRELVWMKPIVVGNEAKDVEVSLVPDRREVKFSVKTFDQGHPIVHCEGRLGDSGSPPATEILDLAGIRARCSEETIDRADLYPMLRTSGLMLGKGFEVVQKVHVGESSCLAVFQLPEHLEHEADRFWLHPSLMDGSVHTAIGLAQRHRGEVPWSVPYSVRELEFLHPLKDLRYGYVTWNVGDLRDERSVITMNIHLLDEQGKVLLRVHDFVAKPLQQVVTKKASTETIDLPVSKPAAVSNNGSGGRQEPDAGLQSLVPVWNPVRIESTNRIVLPESTRILLLGSDATRLDWVRGAYPSSQYLELESHSSVEDVEKKLGDCSFDQLLWVAPDVDSDGHETAERLIEQQEEGVLALFRITKALLRLGYATRKLQWTIVTGRTQRVTDVEPIQPAHAGIVGLVGSLAKEHPHWDLRLLDLDSLASVSGRECLSLPWDRQGNALAHRHGEWFEQGLARVGSLPQSTPVYRKNGVYVVIGGAGGVGEVWSRFMIEKYQANLVWIGRRELDSAIEDKIHALAQLGPAPLYVLADATDLAALRQACTRILETYPAIHGVVHSAIVLQDQSIARMEESVFRASLSAKVDVSVNLDRVFGGQELDFMLFFSSIVSFVKSPGQSNYAAGCTFKDSFAHALQQRRPYPVKIMNWAYWGNVGVVADELHNKVMAQMGIGSIEPDEGMASLQMLAGSGMRQMALIKTLNPQATAGLNVLEAVTYYPRKVPTLLPQVQETEAVAAVL
jgi:acyl transferase domain-containing protein/tryptophanase/acyl carrier protein